MLQRRIELCGDAPRAPMQPCKRRVRPPTGSPPAQGRFPPVQVQSEKSQGVRGTESPDSFDNTPKKPRITCPFFRGKYKYPAPTQPTFCRLLQRVDARKVEEVILAIQEQVRGPAPKEHLIVFDGKQPKHGGGASVLSAVTVPSQHYLGSAVVNQKTNEIPVAQELFKRLEFGRSLGLFGRLAHSG